MSIHFEEKCAVCGKITSQCRCMACNKEIRHTVCKECRARLTSPTSKQMKAESARLREALHNACDNWTHDCYAECRALNCMHVDVCEGGK